MSESISDAELRRVTEWIKQFEKEFNQERMLKVCPFPEVQLGRGFRILKQGRHSWNLLHQEEILLLFTVLSSQCSVEKWSPLLLKHVGALDFVFPSKEEEPERDESGREECQCNQFLCVCSAQFSVVDPALLTP